MSRLLGKSAEDRAVAFLAGLGYEIVERNFTCKMGELDIVARKDGTVVFVEVKSRAETKFGLAQEAVVFTKRRKLLRAAALYAQLKRLDCPQRFDVIADGPDGLEHIEDAFGV